MNYHSLADVMDRLCESVNNLTQEMMKSITLRDWLFNSDLNGF